MCWNAYILSAFTNYSAASRLAASGTLTQSQTHSGHMQLIENKTSFNCEQQSAASSFLWGGVIHVWSKIIIAAVSKWQESGFCTALNFRDLCFHINEEPLNRMSTEVFIYFLFPAGTWFDCFHVVPKNLKQLWKTLYEHSVLSVMVNIEAYRTDLRVIVFQKLHLDSCVYFGELYKRTLCS